MSLAELIAAYKAGTLTEPLMLDNDQTSLYTGNDDPASWHKVFEMDPQELLEQALTLLGIPWEHV